MSCFAESDEEIVAVKDKMETLSCSDAPAEGVEATSYGAATSSSAVVVQPMVDYENPQAVLYCPNCTLPPEYCSFGVNFDKCVPWILDNCPEVLDESTLNKLLGDSTVDEGEEKKKKSKRGGIGLKKKAADAVSCKVVIAKIQRQKRKFITAISGLETVPDLRLKDAVKCFGKKFSSGASVNETATGGKEVVIQGDVMYDLPDLLKKEFKVPGSAIFLLEDGALTPCG